MDADGHFTAAQLYQLSLNKKSYTPSTDIPPKVSFCPKLTEIYQYKMLYRKKIATVAV